MRAWIKHFSFAVLAASLTSGCIMYRLEELRQTQLNGTPFQDELAKLYMDFATHEEKEYDWQDSWYFADKGLQVAYGKTVAPEELSQWNIPAHLLPEMEKARGMLMEVLTPDVMEAAPSRAADAQFFFDCWVEQQEENWQTEDIAYCRDNFVKTLESLSVTGLHLTQSKAAPAKKSAKKSAPKAKPKPASSPAPIPAEPPAPASSESEAAPSSLPAVAVEKTLKSAEAGVTAGLVKSVDNSSKIPVKAEASETISYAVFFESGAPALSEPGKNVVAEIIASLKNVANYEIYLRTDGSKENAGLLDERAQTVKKALVDSGVTPSSIKAPGAASGNASGMPVAKRIEIFINE